MSRSVSLVARIAFSHLSRETEKTIGRHASREYTLLPVDYMRPPSELSSDSGPIVGPCRLRLVAAHLTVFLLAFLAVYLQRIQKTRGQCSQTMLVESVQADCSQIFVDDDKC